MNTDADVFFEPVLDALCGTRTKHVELSDNAAMLLTERYLTLDESGNVSETPEDMFRRVAKALAEAEEEPLAPRWETAFYEVMARLEFHPGSRTLANAGTRRPQLANCFVFPLEDSQPDILQTLKESSIIKGSGGGCGFNYSNIRPSGDAVRGVAGMAVGPVGLLTMFDQATNVFRQRGRYESGNMAILDVDHPDVIDFIKAKSTDGSLRLTNLSLGVSDAFMRAVQAGERWRLINRRSGKVARAVPATEIFDAACAFACETGDPGLVFLDRLNRDNPLRDAFGDIIATNTCGEIGLYPYESCNLGYLNLPKFLRPPERRTLEYPFDLERLRMAVAVAVRMIDNAISVSWFPFEKIATSVRANRRVGIGVTGWADCLALSGIPYDSVQALELAERIARFLYEAAAEASRALGRERGPFPNVVHSHWAQAEDQPRNVALLALPPSGNNAIIFDTSFSIEPFFGLTYTQRVLGHKRIDSINRLLLEELERRGIPAEPLVEKIAANAGSIQGLGEFPEDLQRVFKTAHDIRPEWHIRMQAAFQRYVDNAVTKTVNLPSTATPAQVAELFMLAWELGCKGITVYRDRSKSSQAIEFSTVLSQSGEAAEQCSTAGAGCEFCD